MLAPVVLVGVAFGHKSIVEDGVEVCELIEGGVGVDLLLSDIVFGNEVTVHQVVEHIP